MNATPSAAATAVQIFQPAPDIAYSIDAVAHLTQTPRHLIAVYCRHGLVVPLAPPEREGWWFDGEAIRTLRQLDRLRRELGVNLQGLRVLAGLLDEIERLRDEARFLRSR
jgi:DNA-binding transcriptional MerR regulator